MQFLFSKTYKSGIPLVFPVFMKNKKYLKSGLMKLDNLVERVLKNKVFEGENGEIYAVLPDAKCLACEIILAGFGDPAKFSISKILNNVGLAVKTAKKTKLNNLSIYAPEEFLKYGEILAEAVELANYESAKYKTGIRLKKIKEHDIQKCFIFAKKISAEFKNNVQRGGLVAQITNITRDWVNAPPNKADCDYIEEETKKIAKEFNHKIAIFRKKDIEKFGMGGILAVSRGAPKEPRLIILEYWPANSEKEKPIIFVGKGITFDSGGYNLKPAGFIEDMHLDMAGAATVLNLFRLLRKFEIKVPVIGITPIAENTIDANAYKPSEIIKMYDGKTVEITNTDGEGRLILADAVSYAAKQYKPRYLIDIATLTGACMVALGEHYAGVFSNDRNLKKMLIKTGRETGELLWPLPLHPDFMKSMEGELSDLQNADLPTSKFAGASKGAAFIKHFVPKNIKWAHIDIAGVAYKTSPKKSESKRASGFGVRLLIKFLKNLQGI